VLSFEVALFAFLNKLHRDTNNNNIYTLSHNHQIIIITKKKNVKKKKLAKMLENLKKNKNKNKKDTIIRANSVRHARGR